MQARNLIPLLTKFSGSDTEVTVVIDNSEKTFNVLSVQPVAGKIILVLSEVESIGDVPPGDDEDTEKVTVIPNPDDLGAVEPITPTALDPISEELEENKLDTIEE